MHKIHQKRRQLVSKLRGSYDEKINKSTFTKKDLGIPSGGLQVVDDSDPFSIQNAIDKLPQNPGGLIWIAATQTPTAEIICNIEDTSIIGAGLESVKIQWAGAPGSSTNPLFIIKAGTATTPRNFALENIEIKSNSRWVFPFDAYVKNGVFKDLIVNHTLFLRRSQNKTVLKNIYQKGEYGGAGNDYGVNMVGKNITIDNFVAELATEYQAGFVINYIAATPDIPYENILLKNIYVKGNFGSFVHWYIPRSGVQKIGGNTTIKNFHVEYTGVPKWGHFATFPLLDTEGVTGTYSGDFGKITIKDGVIIGPSQTMVGTENGIGVCSLIDQEVAGSSPLMDASISNVKIQGMRRFDTSDIMCPNMLGGKILLKDIWYIGTWAVWFLSGVKNMKFEIISCRAEVGANAIKVESTTSGSSLGIFNNNFLSNDLTLIQNTGHSMSYHAGQNTRRIVNSGDAATPIGIENVFPRADNTYFLGTWVPQRQWRGLYLGLDGKIVWMNDTVLKRSAADVLETEDHFVSHDHVPSADAAWELGKDTKKWLKAWLQSLRVTGVGDINELLVGQVGWHFIPKTDNLYNCGDGINRWKLVRGVDIISGDFGLENKFRITEAEKFGLGEGVAFLNPKGKVVMILDKKGNLNIAGKIKQLKGVR